MGIIPKWNDWSDSQVLKGTSMTIPGQGFFAGGRVWFWTAPAPEEDRTNEDSLCIVPLSERSGVIAVADGMGGVRGGGVASAIAVDSIAEGLRELRGRSVRTAILDAVERANERVLSTGLGNATTLTILEIDEGRVRLYQVGDSGAIIVGNRGRLKDRTTHHSPVGYAVESGLLEPEAALHSEERHLVSNVVGSSDMRIEIGVANTLARYDTCIVGSDGLFDNLTQDEIIDRARAGALPHKGERILDLLQERMRGSERAAPCKPDDTTIVLFQLVSG